MRLSLIRSDDVVMAIGCSGCGRQYDITLFEFGRTIQCTCGARVGLEHRIEIGHRYDLPRFLADAMLERLARWIRLLGFDCVYAGSMPDEELVRTALEETRIILTRDRGLSQEWSVDAILVLESDELLDQLREVVRRFDLGRRIGLFTRCSRCNAALRPVTDDAIRDRVANSIRQRYDQFIECPACGRIYWEGGHVERMLRMLRGVLGDEPR